MTEHDRARLAAILGMLGSAHAGERAAAALQAERFRKQHGLSWEEVLATQAAPIEEVSEPEPPPKKPEPRNPEPAQWTPPPQTAPVAPINWWGVRNTAYMLVGGVFWMFYAYGTLLGGIFLVLYFFG